MQTETAQLETVPELPTLKILKCHENGDLEAFRLFLLSGGKFHCSIRCDKEKLEKGEDCGC